MRKVLLATTALVAMGGVSAASADVSLAGSGTFTYQSWSDNATTGDDTTAATATHFTVSGATTSDSGMSFGGTQTVTNGAINGRSLYVSDDWGKVTFGGASAARSASNSAAVSSFNGGVGDSTFTNVAQNSRVGGAGADSRVTYTSPDISGLVINASVSNAGGGAAEQADESAWALSYGTDFEGASVAVDYGSASTGNQNGTGTTTDASSMGATVTVDDITVMVGSATSKNSTGTTKIETVDYGIDYAVNDDLSVEAWALSSKENGTAASGEKLSVTQIGLKYTVTPGLYVSATSRSFDYKTTAGGNNKGDAVTVRVGVTF